VKIAAMQPYFFPYLGYFELINSVDIFVFLTDVNYINKGWISRNRLRNGDKWIYLIVPLKNRSQNKLIYELEIDNSKDWSNSHLTTFVHTYGSDVKNHTLYQRYARLNTFNNICDLNCHTIKAVCEYLGVKARFLDSRQFLKKSTGQSRIISLCQQLKADSYLNAIGGQSLYSAEDFAKAGIVLEFMQPRIYKNEFSILDACFGDGVTSL